MFRQPLRSLWAASHRGHTLAAIVTLALGIGAVTTILSAVNAVLLAPLPYADADRVVRLADRNDARGIPDFAVSSPNFLTWRGQSRTFEALAAISGLGANVGEAGSVERVQALAASANLWQVLGQELLQGRAFTDAEDRDGAAVVILGERLWRARHGADPSLVGRTVRVDGVARTVVGIAPRDVGFSTAVDLWLPLAPNPAETVRNDRRYDVLGRLAPGATLADARAEFAAISARLATEHPDSNRDWAARLDPVRDWIVGPSLRGRLEVLMAGVFALLLVACTNVANLQLARAATRSRELGVRQALGASRAHLVRQMLGESLVLSAVGGALGIALAAAVLRAAPSLLPSSTPRLAAFALDWPVALAACAITALTAFAFGLAPALMAARTDAARQLQASGRSELSARRTPLRQVLVVVQFALATLLLSGALVLASEFRRLQGTALGFQPEQVYTARITLPEPGDSATYVAQLGHYDALLADIRAMPGVRGAGITSEVPMGEINTSMSIRPASGPGADVQGERQAAWRIVSSDTLATLGVPLLRGRGFAASGESSRSMLISASLAAQVFPDGSDPVGRKVRLGNTREYTLVGVVGDVHHLGPAQDATPAIYMPTTWSLWPTMTVVVRASTPAEPLFDAMRASARRHFPDQALFDLGTLAAVLDANVAEPRVQSGAFLAFAVLSLVLAAFGIAGVIAYFVSLRTPEIAMRLALGATPRRVLNGIVGEGAGLSALGIGIGAAAAVAAAALRWPAGAAGGDNGPAILAASAIVLFGVGALASWLPALRTLRISPSEALRRA